METQTIKKTMDYGMFRTMETNRPLIPGYVKALAQSIKECDMTPNNPIIVDEENYIIDGQHRLEACKMLGLPVYYVTISGIDRNEAMVCLNKQQKAWKQEEFLTFYAVAKQGCYKDLYEFWKRTKMKLCNVMVIYPNKQINAQILKSGKMNIDKNPNADKIIDFLNNEVVRSMKFTKNRPFVLAVKKAFEKYNDRQMRKLLDKVIYLKRAANFELYMIAFDNLITKR